MTNGSPLAGPKMREPSSPSQKKAYKIDLNFNRLSPRSKTPLMKMLAMRKNMTAKDFVNRRDSAHSNNPTRLQAMRIENYYSTTTKMKTDDIINQCAGVSPCMNVFREDE
jgi:hypothetical protein